MGGAVLDSESILRSSVHFFLLLGVTTMPSSATFLDRHAALQSSLLDDHTALQCSLPERPHRQHRYPGRTPAQSSKMITPPSSHLMHLHAAFPDDHVTFQPPFPGLPSSITFRDDHAAFPVSYAQFPPCRKNATELPRHYNEKFTQINVPVNVTARSGHQTIFPMHIHNTDEIYG